MVYEAEHVEHGRRIALKVLSPGLTMPSIARDSCGKASSPPLESPRRLHLWQRGHRGNAGDRDGAVVGGTLKERVEEEGRSRSLPRLMRCSGRLGTRAAHDAGVLHRDIAFELFRRCGRNGQGRGLGSDPTLEHMQLTAMGTIQATPIRIPEQLRGKPLDVRSDIYAVGATLYYLLTGRPPFDDCDLLTLVSHIATESPTSPREVRPEIPRALAAVVLQCLAKSPADRPPSYRVLASMLEPLGSIVKTPPPLGIRPAAYAFDTFFAILMPMNVLLGTVIFLARPSSVFGAKPVMATLLAVSYFAITEGVWGASLGKALCGLRVVTESGAPARFARTLLRALVFFLPPWLASGLVLSIAGLVYSMQGSSALLTIVVQIVVGSLMFVTARRSNGFAGIHEWATRTRTVLKSAVRVHGLVQSAHGPVEVPVRPRWLTVRIVDTSTSQAIGAALGYDDRLRRTVCCGSPELMPIRSPWGAYCGDLHGAGCCIASGAWWMHEQVPGQPFDGGDAGAAGRPFGMAL